jgi:hypothetical protein
MRQAEPHGHHGCKPRIQTTGGGTKASDRGNHQPTCTFDTGAKTDNIQQEVYAIVILMMVLTASHPADATLPLMSG